MYGVIRDAFDGEPHFCLRVGEDALRTCTGGPSLPVVTGLPDVTWDYSDDIVSVKAGLFDVAVDGWEVVRVNPVDVPTEVLELVAAQDYAELIARFPDFVATPEIKWLDPSLLTDLPEDRVAVLTADESAPPERSPDEIEAFEDGLRRHIEQQLPGRYFEISTQLGQGLRTASTVVVVPHSVDDYLPTIDAARRQATPEPAPAVLVLSMAHRLD